MAVMVEGQDGRWWQGEKHTKVGLDNQKTYLFFFLKLKSKQREKNQTLTDEGRTTTHKHQQQRQATNGGRQAVMDIKGERRSRKKKKKRKKGERFCTIFRLRGTSNTVHDGIEKCLNFFKKKNSNFS